MIKRPVTGDGNFPVMPEALTGEEMLEARELDLSMAEWARSEYESALEALSSRRK